MRTGVIPSFAAYPEVFGVSAGDQQNSIMKFCFIIGTVQLALACVMNIRKKFREKSLGWVADVGWLMSICALYFVVLMLVVGESVDLQPIALVVGAGFLLVVLFGGMSADKTFLQGLKAGLANVFTDFLDTISAFGNIMSYIRLFAVGLASLAIAQSFNNMASGFTGAGMIAGAAIMIIGHTLNIVMGFLSVFCACGFFVCRICLVPLVPAGCDCLSLLFSANRAHAGLLPIRFAGSFFRYAPLAPGMALCAGVRRLGPFGGFILCFSG